MRDARRWLPAAMVLAFGASRFAFASCGVRFDASTIDTYWQYLDRRWLQDDLWRSVFYLHSQPPGFNLLLGAVLQAAPEHFAALFQSLYLALGLAGHLLCFGLMRRMGVATSLAAALATLMVLTPAWVLFENWLFYDLPVVVLLLAAAYALARHGAAPEEDSVWLVTFCALLLALSLMRSLFHFMWIAAIAIALALIAPSRRLVAALGATAAIAALPCLKNQVVFGKFTASTWLGMNLANVVQQWWRPEDLQRLAAAGNISAVSLVPPFAPLSDYPVDASVPTRFEGVPALSDPRKLSGAPNYNHFAYIALSDSYLRDAKTLVRRSPGVALRGFGNSLDRFMRPASVQVHVKPNRRAIQGYDSWWNRIAFGLVQPRPGKQAYLLLIAGTVLGLAFGGYLALRKRALNGHELQRLLTARFMMVTAVFVFLVGNAFERGENHRFRVYLSPFTLTFLAVAGESLLRRFRSVPSLDRHDAPS